MTTERQKTDTDVPPHDLLTAAMNYAKKEFNIFPLHSVHDQGQCTCGKQDCDSPGKHPRNYNGLKGATSDEIQILKWWKHHPDSNIGIRTGRGLFILDVDGDEGEDSLYQLEETHGKLPDTWQCLTGRGRHLYLSLPTEKHIKSSRSLVGPHLDVRCQGGYVVAPPSRHRTGRLYAWECSSDPEDIPLAEVPEWLISLAVRKRPRSDQAGRWGSSFKAVVPDGVRNETLFKEACHLRDLGLSRERAEHYIHLRNRCDCIPPLPDWRVDKLLRSAFSYPRRSCRKGRLSEGAEKVFRYLVERSLHRGNCKLGKREIAVAVGLSVKQVFNCTRQLERYGLLRVQEHNGGKHLYFPQTQAIPVQPVHLGARGSTDIESPVQETLLRVMK